MRHHSHPHAPRSRDFTLSKPHDTRPCFFGSEGPKAAREYARGVKSPCRGTRKDATAPMLSHGGADYTLCQRHREPRFVRFWRKHFARHHG